VLAGHGHELVEVEAAEVDGGRASERVQLHQREYNSLTFKINHSLSIIIIISLIIDKQLLFIINNIKI